MDRIAVLLSVYNGNRYIREQIDSILSQKDVDVYLLCRDDGSKDNTYSILEEYHKQFPDRVIPINGVNTGFAQSFFRTFAEGIKAYPDTEFFAFADQDDVWLPRKLI